MSRLGNYFTVPSPRIAEEFKQAMFRLNVLVAENNRPSLNLYHGILVQMGHQVDTAIRGESAWDLFCQKKYHAVLVDYRLPGISGEDLFQRIKGVAPDVDVILLTGNASIDKIVKLVDMGATDYLVKPVNPKRLREMFEKVAIKQKLLADGSSLADELGELPSLDEDLPGPVGFASAPADGGAGSSSSSSADSSLSSEWSGENLVRNIDDIAHPAPSPEGSLSGAGGAGAVDIAELRRLRLKVGTLEAKLEESSYMEARNRELTSELLRLKEERDSLLERVEEMESGLAAVESAGEGAGTDNELRERHEQAERRIDELLERSGQAEQRIDELLEQSGQAEQRIDELLEQKELAEREARELRSRCEQAEGRMDELLGRCEKAEQEAQELRGRCEQAERRLENAEPGSAAESKELARAQTRIRELEDRMRRQSEDVEALEEQVQSRTRELIDLEKSRARLKEALHREKDLGLSRQQENERLSNQVEEVRDQLRQLRAGLSAGEKRVSVEIDNLREKYEAKLAAFEDQINIRDASLQKARDEILSLKSAANAHDEALGYLKEKLKAKNQKIRTLKEAGRMLNSDILQAERTIEERNEEIRKLRGVVKSHENRIRELEKELASREDRLKELIGELETREDQIIAVRTEALQSGEQVLHNTELRFQRMVDSLKSEVESLKDMIENKTEELADAREELEELQEVLRSEREQHAATKRHLEEELTDLREVLTERESILRKGLAEREDQFRALLAERERALEEALNSGQSEAQRLEEELNQLKKRQRAQELQDELKSEWMELGEALVLLDEEVKNKEQEIARLKDDFAKKEYAYEQTIANQRRKYKELEQALEQAAGEKTGDDSAGGPGEVGGASPSAVSLEAVHSHLQSVTPAELILDNAGVMLKFNPRLKECLAMDDLRRPGQARLDEVPGARQLMPIFTRIRTGVEPSVERPIYIRAPGHEPRAYWAVASKVEQDGEELFHLELFDVSDCPDVLSLGDFSDAKIAFDRYDGVYNAALKVRESLFSMRIVIEILNKKFKHDLEMRTMVQDVLKELDTLIELVQEIG